MKHLVLLSVWRDEIDNTAYPLAVVWQILLICEVRSQKNKIISLNKMIIKFKCDIQCCASEQ